MSEKETKEKKESKKETKNMEGAIQTYTVQPVMSPLVPVLGDPLTEAFDIDAAYVTAIGQLVVQMSFMIPTVLNPNDVTIKQFYMSGGRSTRLEFYVVYACESTGPYKQVDCEFKASEVDAAGNPIALRSILSIKTMLFCTVGPKSSRGIMSTVRTTED